jgi:hypothetical protein
MPKLDFHPTRDGWHFPNQFENRILPGVINGVSTHGLCGGMSMSALDYWRAGVPMPAHEPGDLPPDRNQNPLPDEASRLRRYIFDRQMNSLLTRLMFTRWITIGITPQNFHDWAVGSELEVVKQQLAQGRPTMLGLWSMQGGPTSGHQVLCYGFEQSPPQLYIYDPNLPDEEAVLMPDSPSRGCRVRGLRTGREFWYRGYFFTDVYNWGESPPYAPPYRDVVITSGLNISPGQPDLNVGTPIEVAVTVTNAGEYTSRFRCAVVWARDPSGQNIDDRVGGIEPGFTRLQPGESRTIARPRADVARAGGRHTVGVAKESLTGHWQDFPPGVVGASSRRILNFWPPKAVVEERWVDIRESERSDVDTGVILQPGDELSLAASGQIWAGVWLTGLNGPEGWTDRIETNPGSPMHSVPQAHPFALVGRYDDESYFYVGPGISRRAYPRAEPKRLLLRINDNTPANGSGGFRCFVQVWR